MRFFAIWPGGLVCTTRCGALACRCRRRAFLILVFGAGPRLWDRRTSFWRGHHILVWDIQCDLLDLSLHSPSHFGAISLYFYPNRNYLWQVLRRPSSLRICSRRYQSFRALLLSFRTGAYPPRQHTWTRSRTFWKYWSSNTGWSSFFLTCYLRGDSMIEEEARVLAGIPFL